MSAADIEREVKLAIPSDFVLPALDGVGGWRAGELTEQTYTTTYYDTADLRIARWNCALRYRDGEGWTVKAPSATTALGIVRRERTIQGEPHEPPAEALKLLRAYIRRDAVQPVAQLSMVRRRVILSTETGAPAVDVVHDDVTVTGASPTHFQEAEVEWLEGATSDGVTAVVKRLEQAGAVADPNAPSKQQRALGEAANAPREVQQQTLPGKPRIADLLMRAISRAAIGLMAHDPGIRFGGDPEDVHQARVATRRLRSDLRTFGDAIDREWADGLRNELSWLAGVLGAVRDLEVLEERLEHHLAILAPEDVAAAERLIHHMDEQLAEARSALITALESERYLDVLDRMLRAAKEPHLLPAAEKLARKAGPALVRKPWKVLLDAVEALPSEPEDAALHALRILAKRTRYAAEAVASAVGDEAAEFAVAVAELQTVLGEHQDSSTAQTWLRQFQAGPDAFSAGELVMLETTLARSARNMWAEAWHAIDQPSIIRWLRPKKTVVLPNAQLEADHAHQKRRHGVKAHRRTRKKKGK